MLRRKSKTENFVWLLAKPIMVHFSVANTWGRVAEGCFYSIYKKEEFSMCIICAISQWKKEAIKKKWRQFKRSRHGSMLQMWADAFTRIVKTMLTMKCYSR